MKTVRLREVSKYVTEQDLNSLPWLEEQFLPDKSTSPSFLLKHFISQRGVAMVSEVQISFMVIITSFPSS